MICVDRLVLSKGRCWCHLFDDDNDLEALHKFALSIGCHKLWFQDTRYPHYDLTSTMSYKAKLAGAASVDRRHIIRAYRRIR